jgi:response regulator RpfG family c-di-GMP phosphodiesterase
MPQEVPRILVVDDQVSILNLLQEYLTFEGMVATCVSSTAEAREQLCSAPYDVVLLDLRLGAHGNILQVKQSPAGLELLRHIQSTWADIQCILMTDFGTIDTAIEAMRYGATDYILKPFDPIEIVTLLRRVLAEQKVLREQLVWTEKFYHLSETLADALPLSEQLQLIVEMARDNLNAEAVYIITEDTMRIGTFVTQCHSGRSDLLFNVPRIVDALEHGQTVLAHGQDVVRWAHNAQRASATIASLTATQIKCRGVILGVMILCSLRPQHRFTEGQRKALAILGGHAAQAIESAEIYTRLKESFTQTVEGFARAIETKDAYTHGHSDRVAMYGKLIAEILGLKEKAIERVCHGGLMHDIGKIGLHSGELQKPQKLTAAEYQVFKRHPIYGRRIIEPIHFLAHLVPCIYHHHESWDGTGYPEGLRGGDIPIEARILAVADSYDAMTSNRPYRKAMPHDIAVVEFKRCSGKQFDPDVVEAFLSAIDAFRAERRERRLPVPN